MKISPENSYGLNVCSTSFPGAQRTLFVIYILSFFPRMCCEPVAEVADDSILIDGGQHFLLYWKYRYIQWGNKVAGIEEIGKRYCSHD